MLLGAGGLSAWRYAEVFEARVRSLHSGRPTRDEVLRGVDGTGRVHPYPPRESGDIGSYWLR